MMTNSAKSSSGAKLSERPEKALLRDLANMRNDGIAAFRRKWNQFYESLSDEELLTRRNELRLVWIPRFSRTDYLLEFLDVEVPSATDRCTGLSEFAADNDTPIQKVVCEHWLEEAKEPLIVKWDKQRALRANPRCLPAVLALACIRHADDFGFCRNPECPAHYFFRARRDQRYCSATCAWPAKKAAKLKWWHEHRGTKARSRGK